MSARARPGRYPSLHVHGYRSTSPTPILWGLGAVGGGVILLLIVLTITHMGTTDKPADTAVVSATVTPAPPTAEPQPCMPFQTAC